MDKLFMTIKISAELKLLQPSNLHNDFTEYHKIFQKNYIIQSTLLIIYQSINYLFYSIPFYRPIENYHHRLYRGKIPLSNFYNQSS